MKIQAILFDLDDTLYPEIDFVKSGFHEVAETIANTQSLESQDLFTRMMEILKEDGRGQVFDKLLRDLGLHSAERVSLMTYIYRSHAPKIELYPDTRPILNELKERNVKTGIITDGMAIVQNRKILALGLEELVDEIIYTDVFGRDFWKPSSLPFLVASEMLNLDPRDAMYVGDNITKDFIGANLVGMPTVQFAPNPEKHIESLKTAPVSAHARVTINKLSDVLLLLGENNAFIGPVA